MLSDKKTSAKVKHLFVPRHATKKQEHTPF